ncbi:MAG: ATP-binding cassette domain-containing protein [Phycisphaeraceae bacterium]|nr:ATP-binding cassette domain-containing protein [Phycisphaeraceae bacterium]
MSATERAIRIDRVWKKFRVGEFHDSLRDLIPDLFRRIVGRGVQRDELGSKEFWALKDVAFEVGKGESLGIIGPNGAGKSTLLKVLSRIMRPDRGRYEVDGRVSALIEVGAGFHPDLTGRENLFLNGAILGMKRAEVKAREEEIIEFSGIGRFIDTPVKRFSSGMKARLGFAVAAHLKPDILLVDEVLSVGDAAFRGKCVRFMRQLIQSDVTVVFISHILEQVRRLCPRTVVLDQGQTVYDGPTDGAIRKYMELISKHTGLVGASQAAAVIQNVRFCDQDDQEVLEWNAQEPGVVHFDLVVHRPIHAPHVKINFCALGGQWLGVANSVDKLDLPGEPGVYPLKLTLDPVPFVNGDFELQFEIGGVDGERGDEGGPIWSSSQPMVLTVRDPRSGAPGVRCEGVWERANEPGLGASLERLSSPSIS